jgi:hypothetical protein
MLQKMGNYIAFLKIANFLDPISKKIVELLDKMKEIFESFCESAAALKEAGSYDKSFFDYTILQACDQILFKSSIDFRDYQVLLVIIRSSH